MLELKEVRCLALALVVAAVTLTSIGVAAPPDADLLAGRAAFARGAAGDGSSADEAFELFERLHRAAPDNPLYLAYLGASNGLKARDSWMPWQKMKLAEQGIDYLDQSLQQLALRKQAGAPSPDPLAAETTLVAASAYTAFPKNMNRYERGRALLQSVIDGPAFSRFPAPLQVQYLVRASDVAKRDGHPDLEEKYRLQIARLATVSK